MTVSALPLPLPRRQPDPEPFDLAGPLPGAGTTVLEASAGTGKTFTIAGLVARYVAEGRAGMDELLVVSFSRDSTRELRERVRERLVSARDGLAAPDRVDERDVVLRHLAAAGDDELATRRRRLEQGLASFDAATVTTTHGFCQQMLLALGTAGDHDPGAVLVEDTRDLVDQVADDLYLRKWGWAGAATADLMPRKDFLELAHAAAADPATALLPAPDTPGPPGMRARVAAAVRAELDRRIRRRRLIGYDDLLLRLRDTLTDPELGPLAAGRLRDRYQVVLVDEFQDTDPVQWAILRAAFAGHRTMVLIGDPKQAIYGFRGADVHSYLEAAATADTVRTLPTSYRSDAPLLAGLAAVFTRAALGDERIRVRPVTAAHAGRLVDGVGAPVRLRVLPRDGLELTGGGLPKVAAARAAVAADVAAEAVALLSGPAVLRPRDPGPERPLRPGDLAVLVRTNEQARQVSERLVAAGVAAVVTGRRSVFETAAAHEWQLLLEALEQPHRGTRVRRLALGCFVGMTAAELAEGGDRATEELALQLRGWAGVLEERGVAALFETVCLDRSVQPAVLRAEGGERLLTDLRHIAQVLHEAGLAGGLSLTALLGWLRRRREEAAEDAGLERSRRLESDAAAVQVITVHTSKGLEFPCVLVPFAWDLYVPKDPATATFHDAGGERVRDVGGPGGPDWAAHVQSHQREDVDEELRLAYVALTRAQSHLVLWWAPSLNTSKSPLQRLLLHDDPDTVAPLAIPVPADAVAAFERRAAVSAGGLAVEPVRPRPAGRWRPPAPHRNALAAADFDRDVDLDWRRSSYSSLTAAAHDEQRLGSEPDVSAADDESDPAQAEPAPGDGPDAPLRGLVSAWDGLPSGTGFGTLVHAVLEELPGPADPESVTAVVAARLRRGDPGVDPALLSVALLESLGAPLGPLAGGVTLGEVAGRDRLPELEFELPLRGGDRPLPARTALSELVPLWREHCPTGPLAGYPEALAGLGPAPLRGYLTGSIDAVLRVGGSAGTRYLVVDYKTNRLGGITEPLTAWHYRPEALERAMIEAHYPLQALLYDVALHRYLRWRQPGYAPERHLGGVLYLFLRGMTGRARCADGSVPGVFSWRPPAALVVAASDLLAGRGAGR